MRLNDMLSPALAAAILALLTFERQQKSRRDDKPSSGLFYVSHELRTVF